MAPLPGDILGELADEELGRIFGCLNHNDLLNVPAISSPINTASSNCEDWIWRQLKTNIPDVETHVDEDERLVEGERRPAALLAEVPLSPKQQYRLRGYLEVRQLPSLPDALRCAADNDHQAVLDLLLKARADPNIAADSGAFGVGFTQVGAFPLHLAAKRSHLSVLDALLAAGADVDAADQNGRTGLMVASASGQRPAIDWLLSRGATADAVSHYGYTALHYASLLPRLEIVEQLLSAGASPHLTDREGQTPLHVVLNALPRRVERQEETSCDPAGYGDEYCYDRDTSHGYRHGSTEESERDLRVKRTAEALLRRGASVDVRDGRGRTAAEILDAKNRGDLRGWLESLAARPLNGNACDASYRSYGPATCWHGLLPSCIIMWLPCLKPLRR